MTKDLISVIVPCYNVSKFLDDTFKSLENQTYKNIEAIFVNDGSPDDCLQKIENFCKGKAWCKVVSTKNQGLAQARNEGIKVATGEFLYFYDSDDVLHPTILERLHQTILDADISVCKFKRVPEDFDGKYKKVKTKKVETICGTENLLCEGLGDKKFLPNVWNKLYRHSIVKKMDNYPNVFLKGVLYAEDLPFNVQYLSFCEQGSFVKEKLYYYRTRKGSLVHSSFNTKKLSIFEGHKRNLEICKNYPRALEHAKGFICITCIEMLFRIYASDFKDPQVVRQIYNEYKKTCKNIRKSNRIVWYKSKLIPIAIPVMWVLMHRKMKVKKQSKK